MAVRLRERVCKIGEDRRRKGMAVCEISNGEITASVDSHGAELKSLRSVENGTEYMWCGNPAYWGKTSPILFPFIGMLKNGGYRFRGEPYMMTKHGFARDLEFKLVSHEASEVWFALDADEKTKEIYPFDFKLEIGYRLEGKQLKTLWRVENVSEETIYFSIGGHPAFNCPLHEGDRREDYYLEFDKKDCVRCTVIGTDGLVGDHQVVHELADGLLPVKAELFERDAMVMEDRQLRRISLLTPDKKPYVTVSFQTPVVAVWTPSVVKAPFVCIEPWYGLCDHVDFEGSLEERKWGNEVQPGKRFAAEYLIEVRG